MVYCPPRHHRQRHRHRADIFGNRLACGGASPSMRGTNAKRPRICRHARRPLRIFLEWGRLRVPRPHRVRRHHGDDTRTRCVPALRRSLGAPSIEPGRVSYPKPNNLCSRTTSTTAVTGVPAVIRSAPSTLPSRPSSRAEQHARYLQPGIASEPRPPLGGAARARGQRGGIVSRACNWLLALPLC